jgi:hypothetical protein
MNLRQLRRLEAEIRYHETIAYEAKDRNLVRTHAEAARQLREVHTEEPTPICNYSHCRRNAVPHIVQNISAENSFTGFLNLGAGDTCSISVSGSFSGTVTLQRSFDGSHGLAGHSKS